MRKQRHLGWWIFCYILFVILGGLVVALLSLTRIVPPGLALAVHAVYLFLVMTVPFALAGVKIPDIYGFPGGFFAPLIRRRLPALRGLQKGERQGAYVFLCATSVHARWLSMIDDWGTWLLIVLVFLPDIGGEMLPGWVRESKSLWSTALVAFKFFFWDAAMAWMLYRLLIREEGASTDGRC